MAFPPQNEEIGQKKNNNKEKTSEISVMALVYHIHLHPFSPSLRRFSSPSSLNSPPQYNKFQSLKTITLKHRSNRFRKQRLRFNSVSASLPALDLTEENICQVLLDARSEVALFLFPRIACFILLFL